MVNHSVQILRTALLSIFVVACSNAKVQPNAQEKVTNSAPRANQPFNANLVTGAYGPELTCLNSLARLNRNDKAFVKASDYRIVQAWAGGPVNNSFYFVGAKDVLEVNASVMNSASQRQNKATTVMFPMAKGVAPGAAKMNIFGDSILASQLLGNAVPLTNTKAFEWSLANEIKNLTAASADRLKEVELQKPQTTDRALLGDAVKECRAIRQVDIISGASVVADLEQFL